MVLILSPTSLHLDQQFYARRSITLCPAEIKYSPLVYNLLARADREGCPEDEQEFGEKRGTGTFNRAEWDGCLRTI